MNLSELADVAFVFGWNYADDCPLNCDDAGIDSHLSCAVWPWLHPRLDVNDDWNLARQVLYTRFEAGVRARKKL